MPSHCTRPGVGLAVGGTVSYIPSVMSPGRLLALIPGSVFLTVFIVRAGMDGSGGFLFTLFDDAMISMTYARTLAETGEWVWFPGADRVQGFTNPLWTLYMAAWHAAGVEGPAAALVISLTGVLLILACAWLTGGLVQRALGDWPGAARAGALAGATVPFLYPLTYWTLRGMEVGLLAFLALLMITGLAMSRARRDAGGAIWPGLALAGMAGALGVATRLDFAVIAGALLAHTWWSEASTRVGLRLAIVAGIPVAIMAAAVLIFQEVYWGDWLTNTYRLKMEGFSAGDRLGRGLVSAAKILPLLLLTGMGLLATRRSDVGSATRDIVSAMTLVVVVTAAYGIWVGGDAWEWSLIINRYAAVALPCAVGVVIIGAVCDLKSRSLTARTPTAWWLTGAVLSGLGVGVLTNPLAFLPLRAGLAVIGLALAAAAFWWTRSAASRAVAAAVLTIAATSTVTGLLWLRDGGPHVFDDQRVTRASRLLADATAPDAVIATVWAGAPAYYSRRPMIDLLGKNDRRIAATAPVRTGPAGERLDFYPGHNKWDYAYSVAELKPDVVFQTWLGGDALDQQLADWGYAHRCLTDGTPMHVLIGSSRVHWDQLRACA